VGVVAQVLPVELVVVQSAEMVETVYLQALREPP
jgi:hypothetical protein